MTRRKTPRIGLHRAFSRRRASPPGRAWLILRGFAVSLALAGLLLVLAACAFWVRLGQGPVALDMLTPRIQAAIDREVGEGFSVTVGGLVIERGGVTGLVARLRDVAVRDREGTALAAVTRADFSLDPRALLTGGVVPRRIDLQAPRFHVERGADGGFALYADPPEHERSEDPPPPRTPDILSSEEMFEVVRSDTIAGPAGAAAAFVERITEIARVSGDPRLRVIGVKDARITYEGGQRAWRLDGLDAALERGGPGEPVTLTLEGASEDRPFLVRVAASERAQGGRTVSLRVRNVRPYRLRVGAEEDSHLLDIPVSADIRAVFDAEGDFADATGSVDVTARPVRGEGRARRREAHLAFAFDPATRSVRIERSHFAIGESEGRFSGTIAWPALGQENREGIAVDLDLRDLVVAQPDVDGPSLALDTVSASGRVKPGLGQVEVERLDIASPQARLSLKGTFTRGARSPGFQVTASAQPIDASALKQLWPPFLARRTRGWVVEHVHSGRTGDAVFIADVAPDALAKAKDDGVPLPEGAMHLTFGLQDAALDYFGDLPAMRDVLGLARMTGNSFTVSGAQGTVETGEGEELALSEARFHVPRIHGDDKTAGLSLRARGAASALLRYAGHRPLNEMGRLPVGPEDVDGRADGRVALDFPMREGVDPRDVEYDVAIDFTGLAARDVFEERDFTQAGLGLEMTPERFALNGRGMLAGIPANVELESDGPPRPGDFGRYELSLLIDENTGDSLGIDLSGVTRGPVRAQITGEGGAEDIERVELDLTNARIVLPQLGTLKAEGEPAELSFVPETVEGGRVLRDLSLSGSGLAAEGEVRLEDGATTVDLGRVQLSEGGAAAVSARISGADVTASVRGEALDARPVLRALLAGEPGGAAAEDESEGTLDVTIDVARAVGLGGEELRDLDLRLQRAGGALSAFSVSAAFASGGTMRGQLGGNRELVLQAGNAGALLRFLNLYSSMRGGVMDLRTYFGRGEGRAVPGRLVLSDFRIIGDGDLERFAQIGEGRRPDRGLGGDMAFDEARVDFSLTPGAIEVREGLARGPNAGGTFRGTIDRRAASLDLTGTYVPAYALNNALARIPVIGNILGGRSDEGLLGITFAVRGPLSAPTLSVNPMSAIAPGLFRRLFEFQEGAAQ